MYPNQINQISIYKSQKKKLNIVFLQKNIIYHKIYNYLIFKI